MTTLATRTREIGDLEGFDVEFYDKNGNPADPKTNGLPKYNFDRKAKSSATISEIKESRFKKIYPDYEVKILKGDGSIANGNTKLSSVRESYEE